MNHLVFGGTISESVTLDILDSGAPYVVVSDWIVSSRATLTIRPGVVIKFDSRTGLSVDGTLIAKATPDQPIYFTSLKDDSVGGDTNGDGNASTPSQADWSSLSLKSGSQDNELDNVMIRYGYGIRVYTSSLTVVSNSTIEKNSGVGIYVSNALSSITGNKIKDNGYGISASSSSATITGNTITGNTDYAILLKNDPFDNTISGNTITGNGINCFCIGGTISKPVTLSAYEHGEIYVVHSDMTVSEEGKLTIDPGIILKMGPSTDITVNGTLEANGTPEQPIYFTSLKDDETGNDDTNGDGPGQVRSGI